MSRLTADLEGVRNFIGFGFAQILNMVLMIVFGGAMMFSIHWQLTLVTLVTIPVLGYLTDSVREAIHPAFREMRQAMSHLTTAVQENITGVRTVKSFARESHEYRNFRYEVRPINESGRRSRNMGEVFSRMELLANMSAVILLIAGGMLVINDSLNSANLSLSSV